MNTRNDKSLIDALLELRGCCEEDRRETGTADRAIANAENLYAELSALRAVVESIQNDRQNGMRISTETLNALANLSNLQGKQ